MVSKKETSGEGMGLLPALLPALPLSWGLLGWDCKAATREAMVLSRYLATRVGLRARVRGVGAGAPKGMCVVSCVSSSSGGGSMTGGGT